MCRDSTIPSMRRQWSSLPCNSRSGCLLPQTSNVKSRFRREGPVTTGPNKFSLREFGLLLHPQKDAIHIVYITPDPNDGSPNFHFMCKTEMQTDCIPKGCSDIGMIYTRYSTYCIYQIQTILCLLLWMYRRRF